MFVRNYSDTDLEINYKGERYTLGASGVTYVEDSWISFPMIKAMYGNYVCQVTPTTPIEEFLFDNQTIPELNKIYLTRLIGPGLSNLFIKEGKVNIYFDDGKEIPSSKADMSLFTNYTGVDGMLNFETIPKYVLFETSANNPVVVATNIELTELT